MKARKCDRCGAFYEPEKTPGREVAIGKETQDHMFMGMFQPEVYDLCPSCADSLMQFMERFKTEGGERDE